VCGEGGHCEGVSDEVNIDLPACPEGSGGGVDGVSVGREEGGPVIAKGVIKVVGV
jgi:hypothetical protein